MTTVDEAREALLAEVHTRAGHDAMLAFEAAIRADLRPEDYAAGYRKALAEREAAVRAESAETLAALQSLSRSIDDAYERGRAESAETLGAMSERMAQIIVAVRAEQFDDCRRAVEQNEQSAETLRALREAITSIATESIPHAWGTQRYRRHVLAKLDRLAATPAEEEPTEPHQHPDGSTWHGRRTGWPKMPYIEGTEPDR